MSLLNVNQFNIVDSSDVALDGSIPVAIQFGDNLWSSNYPDGILLSKGTTAERSITPIDGYLRYNTDLSLLEGFTNGGWRPTGQLTIDGFAPTPSRSFISDPNTGTFLLGPDDFGIAAGGSLRVEVTADETFIFNELLVDGILNGGPAFLRITTPNTETGSLTWSDNDNTLPDVEAFIRYNHSTEKFEFSVGTSPLVTFEIDGTTGETTFFDVVNFDAAVNFTVPVVANSFTSIDGFTFIMDSDDDDTSSVFKIQKHSSVDTGFEVNQDGSVQANGVDPGGPAAGSSGTKTDPAFRFANSPTTGWYFNTFPINTMTATFEDEDKILINDQAITFTEELRAPDGAAGGIGPSITFSSDSGIGLFKVGADELGISAGLLHVASFDTTGLVIQGSKVLRIPNASAVAPSIRFDDPNTGIYQRNSDEVNITVGGAERLRISSTEVRVRTNFQTDFTHTRGDGSTGVDMEVTKTQEETLLANQASTPFLLLSGLKFDGNTFQAMIVEYLVQKVGVGSDVGTFHIVVDDTASTVDFVNTVQATVGASGITFAASISAGTVTVNYTSGAGVTATMRYVIKRWGV